MTKKGVLKFLREIKKDIPNNTKLENYENIYNACVDIDNEYPNLDLVDYIWEQNFIVSEEDEKLAIENNSDSIERLRYFIGRTYSDDLYKINAYGNLSNVSDGDMCSLCDDLIGIVKRELFSQQEM